MEMLILQAQRYTSCFHIWFPCYPAGIFAFANFLAILGAEMD